MSTYEDIYAIVRQIPNRKVATYGQVAELANLYGKARLVGYASIKWICAHVRLGSLRHNL